MILNSIATFFRSIIFSPPAVPSPDTITGSEPAASAYRSAPSTEREAQGVLAKLKAQLARALAKPDPKTLAKLAELNQKRRAKGLAPIDLKKTTAQLEAIQDDGSLGPKEKKKKIEALRRQLGLSKGEMKELFTKRLGNLYRQAEKSLEEFQQAKSAQLKAELKQAESRYGKGSPQAQAVATKLDSLQRSLEPERKRLAERGGLYRSLYPGFLAKLGGFFKKVGGGFLKVLGGAAAALRILPGVGRLASRVLGSVKFLFQGFRVDKIFKNIGGGILDVFRDWKRLLPLIPGVGGIAAAAASGIEAVVKATRAGSKLP